MIVDDVDVTVAIGIRFVVGVFVVVVARAVDEEISEPASNIIHQQELHQLPSSVVLGFVQMISMVSRTDEIVSNK